MNEEIKQIYIQGVLSDSVYPGELERILLNKKYKSCVCFLDDVIDVQYNYPYPSGRYFTVWKIRPSTCVYIHKFGNSYYNIMNSSLNIYRRINFKKTDLSIKKISRCDPEFNSYQRYVESHTFFFTDKDEFDDYLKLSSAITFKKMLFKKSDQEKLFLKLLES